MNGDLCMSDKFNQLEYTKEYQKTHYDEIKFRSRKEKMIKSRLETLCISTGKTKNELIEMAIEKLLQDNNL